MDAAAPEGTRTCYRHRDRETGVSCSSCGRAICPDCMTPTPVGMRCPECSRQKTKVRTPRSVSSAAPIVSQVIIGVCVLAWFAELATTNGDYTIRERGGLFGPIMSIDGEWWRLVTSGFLHDDRMPTGLLHIGFNMYLLWMLGQMLESSMGRVRFGVVYVTCLLGGSAGALLLSPDSLTVGASGAVFGLMGLALVDFWSRGIGPMETPLGGLLLLNLVITFGFAGSISVGGHLGGLAAGGACGYIIYMAGRRAAMRRWVLPACVALGVALAIVGVLAADASVDPVGGFSGAVAQTSSS